MQYLIISLAIVFLLAGGSKLAGIKKHRDHFKHWNLGLMSMYIVGAIEVLAGILMLQPRWAAAGLVIGCYTMAGAITTLLVADERKQMLVPITFYVLLSVCLWTLLPFQAGAIITLGSSFFLISISFLLFFYPLATNNFQGEQESVGNGVKVKHHFKEVLGVNYHYVVAGNRDRPAVLIVPGMPESWLCWKHQIATLSKDYYVIAIDMKPFGQTSKDLDGNHSYPQIAEEIKSLLDELDVYEFYAIGQDRGAVALDHLAAKEDMSNRMLKYVRAQQSFDQPHGDPVPPHWLFSSFFGSMLFKIRWFVPVAYNHTPYVKYRFNKGFVKELTKDFHRKHIAVAMPLTFKTTSFQKELVDRKEWLFKHLTMPLLLLQGKHDIGQHVEEYLNSQKAVPTARVEFIDAGHFLHLEKPELVNHAVLKFFKEPPFRTGKREVNTDSDVLLTVLK